MRMAAACLLFPSQLRVTDRLEARNSIWPSYLLCLAHNVFFKNVSQHLKIRNFCINLELQPLKNGSSGSLGPTFFHDSHQLEQISSVFF